MKREWKKLKSIWKLEKREGAKLLAGGYALTEGELAKGNYFAPTLFTRCNK